MKKIIASAVAAAAVLGLADLRAQQSAATFSSCPKGKSSVSPAVCPHTLTNRMEGSADLLFLARAPYLRTADSRSSGEIAKPTAFLTGNPVLLAEPT